jgi:CDP-diacylglycerol--serine O-phosphatidyltransferase
MTGTSSEFGKQFDSLADMISFGVAPALLSWFWVLSDMERLGQGLTFLFVVCVAMRLARFNLQPGKDRRHFVGMPSPAAAGTMGAAMLVFETLPEGTVWVTTWAIFHSTVALLMISRFRYRSFKDFDLRSRRSIGQAIPLALALWGLIFWPPLLLLVAIGYMFSAPLLSVGSRFAHLGPSSKEMGESGGRRP